MVSGILIRAVELLDLDLLVELIHTTIKTCYPSCYRQEVIDFFIDYHSSAEVERKAKEGVLLVAIEGEKPIASGYLVGKEIGGVYVHPSFQKKGIAKLMVRALLREAEKQNLQSVWLESTPIALRLYESLGFQLDEEKVMFVENNAPLPYYHMVKELKPKGR